MTGTTVPEYYSPFAEGFRIEQAERYGLLPKDDPSVAAVQDAVFVATGQQRTFLARHPALYREPYVVSDVLRYRAAALALAHIESNLWRHFYYTRILLPEEARRLEALHAKLMESIECGVGTRWYDIAPRSPFGEPSPETLIQAMTDWRSLFSPTGFSYRSLDRTLMNPPSDVESDLICELRHVHLERPIVNRTQLIAFLLRVRCCNGGTHDAALSQLRILQHATEAEICRATQRIAIHTRRPLCASRSDDLAFVVQFLADYPEPHRGNLSGLVSRAIGWHRAPVREKEELVLTSLGPDTPTALPSVPPPAIPGVTFLRTLGEVIIEGRRMQHCIGERARAALEGRCFLFHVEHGGECASIEVTATGKIRQAVGPRNTDNAAAKWGAEQLRVIWAR